MKKTIVLLILFTALISSGGMVNAQNGNQQQQPKAKPVPKIVVPKERGKRSVVSEQVSPSGAIMANPVPPPKKVVIVPAPPPGGPAIPVPRKR